MKKLLLSLSVLAIFGLPKVTAQIINADFETWTQDALATTGVLDPNSGSPCSGWWDFNMTNSSFLGSSPVTVFQGSANPAPEGGSYYAEIVSQPMSSSAYSLLNPFGFSYPDTNGVIITAYIDASLSFAFKPGIPFNQRITEFSFYYRYIPNGIDTCSCSVELYHWNSTANKSYLIGAGIWTNYAKVSSWSQANVNVVYDSASTPDTIIVLFSACSIHHKPKAGDTMDIDNATVTGIDNVTAAQQDNVNIYPDPANAQISLTITGQFQAKYVEVYDITGKSIGTYTMNNNLLTINTQLYNSGIYLYKLLDNTGAQLNVGKFSVAR